MPSLIKWNLRELHKALRPFHKKGQMKELSAPVYDSTEVGTKVTKTKEKGHRDDTIAELMEMITKLELDMVVKE
ncbi:hypothetical protein M0R45_002162 [Rubus argutus]|uniref:Uncharacterized protein n=1 Tax=Rubus argutus TaxID=59490 RepID=A0AAW1VKA5_RUBAR